MADLSIQSAWLQGEKTCFDKMRQYAKGVDAWRGVLPENREGAMLTSGGLGAGDMARYLGPTPVFCSLFFAARIACQFNKRDKCLDFAGKVLFMLKDTNNLKNVGNVQRLELRDLPQEPTGLEIAQNQVFWEMEIPLIMILSTTTVS